MLKNKDNYMFNRQLIGINGEPTAIAYLAKKQ